MEYPILNKSSLFQQIGNKDIAKDEIALQVAKDDALVFEVIQGLSAANADTKYACVKILRIISEKEPSILYPRIDFFIELLDNNNKIMKWGGIHIIGNLAAVDTDNRIDRILDKYLEPIPGPVMVTAANVIGGATKIASAKPYLADRIAMEILKVEDAEYQTIECRNVALGHAIKSFDTFFDHIKSKELVIELIKRQLNNTRNTTRKAAEKFFKYRKC